jgi:hypothetical protein
MADVLSFTFGTFTGLGSPVVGPTSGAQSYVPRGAHNEQYKAEPDAGAASTRPTAGQAWPRGNVRGNG